MDVLLQYRFGPCQGRFHCPLAGLCVAALFACGCAVTQKKPRIPWATAVLVRPTLPQQITDNGASPDIVPSIDLEIPAPEPLAVVRMIPARPRTIVPPAAQNGSTEKRELPQIVPDLSPQQSSSFQHETEQSLKVAEQNLAAAAGRRLSPTQADLASKVRSFVRDAREAGRAGDWGRARDLARKAEVLSDELASSF